jgi:hypothetical protein
VENKHLVCEKTHWRVQRIIHYFTSKVRFNFNEYLFMAIILSYLFIFVSYYMYMYQFRFALLYISNKLGIF